MNARAWVCAIWCAVMLSLGACGGGGGGAARDLGCDKTDPFGKSCTKAEQCRVLCKCVSGGSVQAAACSNMSCNGPESVCDAACLNLNSTWTKDFCFVGTP
jgi:hypothetical protein